VPGDDWLSAPADRDRDEFATGQTSPAEEQMFNFVYSVLLLA
jgi:hypothetical protein